MHAFDDDVVHAPRPAARSGADASSAEPALAPARGPATPGSLVHLQRTAGNAGVAQLLQDEREGIARATSHGQPLDAGFRVQMEQSIGADFSSVRVHTGGEADASAKQLGAHAYTVGDDIVFASGRYDPGSETGQRTLAHELTHVVQQRSGPVEGTPTAGGVQVSDPGDRFERAAEANADRVMSQRSADTAAPAVQTELAPGSAVVQREGEMGEEDDEMVQGLFVQRDEAMPEEEEITAEG